MLGSVDVVYLTPRGLVLLNLYLLLTSAPPTYIPFWLYNSLLRFIHLSFFYSVLARAIVLTVLIQSWRYHSLLLCAHPSYFYSFLEISFSFLIHLSFLLLFNPGDIALSSYTLILHSFIASLSWSFSFFIHHTAIVYFICHSYFPLLFHPETIAFSSNSAIVLFSYLSILEISFFPLTHPSFLLLFIHGDIIFFSYSSISLALTQS